LCVAANCSGHIDRSVERCSDNFAGVIKMMATQACFWAEHTIAGIRLIRQTACSYTGAFTPSGRIVSFRNCVLQTNRYRSQTSASQPMPRKRRYGQVQEIQGRELTVTPDVQSCAILRAPDENQRHRGPIACDQRLWFRSAAAFRHQSRIEKQSG
jgi:hypothetical protein